MKNKLKKHKFEIGYFFKNAPLAIFTSSLPGFVNYATILFLTAFYTLEDVGQYRLLISYFSLIGLFSIQQSAQIMVRASVDSDHKTGAALFMSRLFSMLIVTAVLLALDLYGTYTGEVIIPQGLSIIALLSCLHYPFDLFFSKLQAEKKFPLLAGLTLLKYGISFSILIAIMLYDGSIITASLAQIASLSVLNVCLFLFIFKSSLFSEIKPNLNPLLLGKNTNVRESLTLSLANFLPSTLEHIDKMIIGYLYGLEAVGLYTLAFSTGRFIYNSLKPSFYIYYRHFVENLPSKTILYWVMAAFTVFGMILSAIFFACTLYIPFFSKFNGSEAVVYILFLSYGIAMADAIYTQSYGINKKAKSKHLLITNIITGVFCLLLFSTCIFVPQNIALIICALHYPIRHGGTILILSRMRKTYPPELNSQAS